MNAPTKLEYPTWAETYISKVLGDVFELLETQITTLSILFNKNIDKADYAYAEKKWTLKQMLGHIIDTERILVYRLLSIARNEKQTLISFDEDAYVVYGKFEKRDFTELINEFVALRKSNIFLFKSLDEEQLNRVGSLSENRKISAKAMLFVVAGHVNHHLQILNERYELV
ncbi:MAG: DinB family protein [Sphingobacteriaceae bacterium]|nr:DinB family protein [Sphingobacteriaceae bacterium]